MSTNPVLTENDDGTFNLAAFGNQVKSNEDGSIDVLTAKGMQFKLAADGGMTADNFPISFIEIADISKIEKYLITTTETGKEHAIEFVGGGKAVVRIGHEGNYLGVSSSGVPSRMESADGRIVLGVPPSTNEQPTT